MSVTDYTRCAVRFFDQHLDPILGPAKREEIAGILSDLMSAHGRPGIEAWALRIIRSARGRAKSPEGLQRAILRRIREDGIDEDLSGKIDPIESTRAMLAEMRAEPSPRPQGAPRLSEMLRLRLEKPEEFARVHGHELRGRVS